MLIRCNENPFSGSRLVTLGQADMLKLIGTFLQLKVAIVPEENHMYVQ
jgi:hypothetical protein